ncbi:hypothetical protein Tco_0833385 [Tanacetum coccineum]
MDAPTIPVFVDSSEGNFGDAIDIGVDVVHLVPVVVVAFSAVTIVTTLACHEEAIRGIHEHLQGIRTMEAIETVTRSQERRARMEME